MRPIWKAHVARYIKHMWLFSGLHTMRWECLPISRLFFHDRIPSTHLKFHTKLFSFPQGVDLNSIVGMSAWLLPALLLLMGVLKRQEVSCQARKPRYGEVFSNLVPARRNLDPYPEQSEHLTPAWVIASYGKLWQGWFGLWSYDAKSSFWLLSKIQPKLP